MSREKALKRINEYLAKQEPKKIELNSVEDLFKKVKKLDAEHRQDLRKMEKALLDYRSSYDKYETSMKNILSKSKSLSSEKNVLENKLKELGVNPRSVNGFFEAGDMIVDIEQIIKNKERFFTKPSIK